MSPNAEPLLQEDDLAHELRRLTAEVHSKAEHQGFATRILSGDVHRDDYVRYLVALHHVYTVLEEVLEKHSDNVEVAKVHFPQQLSRAKSLHDDIVYFSGGEREAAALLAAPPIPAAVEYVNAIRSAASENPARLVGHSYTRYLGDLSGGQILAKRIKKSFDLPTVEDFTPGIAFYTFLSIPNPRTFKDMFRQGLGSIVDRKQRDAIVAEALKCFELNIGLFADMERLSNCGSTVSSTTVTSSSRCTSLLLVGLAAAVAGLCTHWARNNIFA